MSLSLRVLVVKVYIQTFHTVSKAGGVFYAVIGSLNPSQSVLEDQQTEDRIEVNLLLVIP